MAKKYNGGIVLATGFKIDNPSPVADYLVVELISDLTNPVTLPNQFTGMTTFVLEDQNSYVLKNTGWEKSPTQGEYLPLSGGTVTGQTLFLFNGTPIQLAPENYVGGSVGNTMTLNTPSGETYTAINSRNNGTSIPGNLVLQQFGSGNVGVNTTTPNYLLDVNGTFGAQSVSATTFTANTETIIGETPTSATGSVSTGSGSVPLAVYVQGRYVYVINTVGNSLQIFDASNPSLPVLVGTVLTDTNPRSVYVQGRYAYVVNNNSFQIFDVSNSSSPVSVSLVPYGTFGGTSIYAQGRYVYIVNYSFNLLQIFDVSKPSSPVLISTVTTGPSSYGLISIYVQGKYVYVVNFVSNKFEIFDVSNPSSPISVGSASTGSQPQRIYVQGRYAYVVGGAGSLQIFDVSNPSLPVLVGTGTTGTNPYGVYVQGRYAYVVNYLSSTFQIFDVSNPSLPVSVGSVSTGVQPRNIYVQGRYAYVVNQNSNSLQIFDVGGSYIQQLEVGGILTNTLESVGNATIGNNLTVVGGLNVSQSVNILGDLSATNMRVVSGLTANTISATTYQNLPATPYLPLSGGSINGQLFITPTTTDYPLEIYSRNFVGGSSGTRTFFYAPSGVTYSVLNVRSGGGPSPGNLLLQSIGSGKVGINTDLNNPTLNFDLDVNGSIGATSVSATSVSATTYYNLPTGAYLPLSGGTVTGPVIIKDDSNPLFITSTNYSPGVSGNIMYFGVDVTGATNGRSIYVRSNGGGSSGNLYLQPNNVGRVGINTNIGFNPILNYNLDVNGSIGATSVSATTISGGTVVLNSTNLPSTLITVSAFTDDYNRVTLSPGGSPSLTYTNTNTGAGNATISASTYLNIANGNPAGQSYTTVPLSGFNSPFNPTLSLNTGTIEWSFNLRTNRSTIFPGFSAGTYGAAVVLAGTSGTLQNAGNGYALVYGGTGTRNWRLVRYTSGLFGTRTDIISGGVFAAGTNYVSARIVYTPSTNTWTYYFRDDGAVAWGDPTTVTTLIGSAVDSTYTSSLMSSLGVYFNYSTAANQNLQFDNLVVKLNSPSVFTPQSYLTLKNYANTSVFDVKDDGSVTSTGLISSTGGISGTTISGGTYFGNGSALTLGQFGTMITGSTSLLVTNTTTALTLIPGLTTTITVPTQTMVCIQTNGGVNTVSTSISGGSAIDVALVVDGLVLPNGGYQRMYADNPTGNATVANWVANWNMSVILTLSAGTHTVEVNTATVQGQNATVSGGFGAVNQGTLTIMILKNT